MKKDIHPTNYRLVVFQDTGADFAFLTKSTVETEETTTWTDGKEYPLVKMHVSSASHPFYTGEKKVLDVEGRVDKFNARKKAAAAASKDREASAKKAVDRAAQKGDNPEGVQKIGEKKQSSKSTKPKAEKKSAPAEQKA